MGTPDWVLEEGEWYDDRRNDMKVILVNGSPHKNGCTYTALAEVAGALEKEGVHTEIFQLGTDPIAGCIACGVCNKTGKCFRDDLVNEFLERAEDADGFVFGSPVHYVGLRRALFLYGSRCFMQIEKTACCPMPTAAVVSCRRGGASAAFDRINKYFTISNMPIVSSQYWNMVHGLTADDVKKDLEGLQTMRTLGVNLAWLLKSIEAGRAAGVEIPIKETSAVTNFIR